MTTVKIYNQSIGLDTDDFRLKELLAKFIKDFYTQPSTTFNKSPYAATTADKVFVNKILNETSYIFHRNQFIHLLSYLEMAGYDMKRSEKIDLRNYEVATIDVPIRDGWVPFPKQELAIDFLVDNPRYSKLLPTQTGSGKAAPLNSLIKIPGGWSTMGQMQVGTKVIAKDGTTCNVIGVHPQGLTPCFKITFADGRTAVCSYNHLWKVYETQFAEDINVCVMSVLHLGRLMWRGGASFWIDLIDSEGSSEENQAISNVDIIDGVVQNKGWLDSNHVTRVKILRSLLKHNLASNEPGFITVSVKSDKEAEQITSLVRSLGGVVYKKGSVIDEGLDGSPSKQCMVIRIRNAKRFTDCGIIEFEIPFSERLQIINIEQAKFEETQCITIDHPDHLYVTDDYIVTHNSLMSMVTLSRKGLRTGICILPSYIEKTIIDMGKILEIDTKEIMVIQGSKSLGGLIDMAKEGEFNSPFTIFSASTMSNFNKGYEEEKEFTISKYGISPIELFPLLKIGVMLIDETHQHFHIIYKQILNSNVKQLIGMSATYITDDPFIKRMHGLIYPQDGIYKNFGHVRYIDVYSISYSVNPDYQKLIRTNEFGSTFYSHTAYEQSIHKNPYLRKRYYNLIRTTLDDYFLSEYKQGDRFAVFVSTVAMATEVTEYLKEAYPLLDIRRYCEKDPYENLTDPDGRVTTVISAGTNKDIKKLRVVVNTISISSSASNLQLIGRLRQLEDLDVKFCQLFCEGLRKHHAYKAKRDELFKGKVKNIYERRSRVNV